jgi:hypothetical protein
MTPCSQIFSSVSEKFDAAIVLYPEDGGARLVTAPIYEAGSEAALSSFQLKFLNP